MAKERAGSGRGGKPGRVVETVGRRVRVRDADGERVCFLAGQRAVVGDRVRWEDAPGEGGKLVAVEPRGTVLRRVDAKGREQVLAANLEGLLVVVSASNPGFRAALLDRYLVAASAEGLKRALVLTKIDLPVPPEVEAQVALRGADGLPVLRVSSTTGEGVVEVADLIAEAEGPWALVGGSGVGKTSLASALLPGEDVGEIGEISEFWGTGRHTTTHSRLFRLPGGGEMADSPGIRNFTPVLRPGDVRDHFPIVREVACRYRDCLHRRGEEGCVADAEVDATLLGNYRDLLAETEHVRQAQEPWR